MNYNNRRFRPVQSSENGEVTVETLFVYYQTGNIVTSEYKGDSILLGHLRGLVDEKGNIDMHYHQVKLKGELMTGICTSIPEIMENGKIRLIETWEWTSGEKSKGESILEEI